MPEFTLYSRPGCHLCQDLEQELRKLQTELGFRLAVVDIDRDAALVERWGRRVPVLTCKGEVVCEVFLDPVAVRAICRPDERV